jgi:rhodanese-related sulfurtransferase
MWPRGSCRRGRELPVSPGRETPCRRGREASAGTPDVHGLSEYGEHVSEPTHHVIQDIGPDEAVDLVNAGAILLDVREDEEWVAGHSPQAIHVAMGEIENRASELPEDRTVVCVCRVGGRSGAVAKALVAAGYDVRNLDGGMLAWAAAGFPVVTDSGDPGEVV